MSTSADQSEAAAALRSVDRVMGKLIDAVGPAQLHVDQSISPFQALLRAIIYQQLATGSAAAIYARVRALCEPDSVIIPEKVQTLDPGNLLQAGLSRAKLAAITHLTELTLAGVVPTLEDMRAMEDADIIKRVTEVKGIGPWTVQMMLIYCLGRPDVLPAADFGIRKGYQLAYRESKMRSPKSLLLVGRTWSPYRTLASWYLWRATDSVDWSKFDR